MRNEDVKEYRVRKNGKKSGKITAYKRNVARLILIGGSVVIFSTGFAAGRVSKKTIERSISYDIDNMIDYEPRYDGIPYYVRGGDTLLGIIYSYETDSNKAYQLKDDIMYVNHMKYASLQYGETITLCGIPESKLEDFGYTVNYNFFEPTFEVEDRLLFLDKVEGHLKLDDELKLEISQLHDRYRLYQYNYVPYDEQSEKDLNDLVQEIRDVCEDVEKNYGYSFDNNKVARPLSEATRHLEERERLGL